MDRALSDLRRGQTSIWRNWSKRLRRKSIGHSRS